MDGNDPSGLFVILVLLIVGFGIVLPILLAKSGALQKVANKLPTADAEHIPVYNLVRCDCGANTNCPQGKRPFEKGGNPYRCQIWKEIKR